MTTGPNDPRRSIPAPIQREVRQRCGFGCVICGLPIYEYEHMLGWANVKRHVADEITLLCDQHHREKTNGLLPTSAVEEANKNPYNLREGTSKAYNLHYSGDSCIASIGDNTFYANSVTGPRVMHFITIDGVSLLNFVLFEGQLLLNLLLFDDNNNPILEIQENILLYSAEPWDISFTGRNLIIREARSKILIDILFEVPNKITLSRGRILFNGLEIIVKPDGIFVSRAYIQMSGNISIGFNAGIIIGQRIPGTRASMYLQSVNRYDRYAAPSIEDFFDK